MTTLTTRHATRQHFPCIAVTLEHPNGSESVYMKLGELWYIWRDPLWDGVECHQAWVLIGDPAMIADLNRRTTTLD